MKTVTKHSLWASGLSLLLCAALLLGTTFAWFTDSVTNTGNTITAGTLGIKATVAEVDKNAAVTYTVPGLNGGAPFGFGNTHYDDQAGYLVGVSSAEELAKAAADGNSVRLDEDIVLTGTLEFGQTATLQMNGHTLTVNNGTGSVKTTGSLTVEGNGLLKGTLVADTGATLVVNAGDDFKVETSFATGAAVSAALNTTVEINGGTYSSFVDGGAGVIDVKGSYLTVRNATVNANEPSMVNLIGINAPNAKETLLENVTVNGNYSTAVKLNGSMTGNATIIGGTFTTDHVAEGWKPKPTIQYGGTLNISGATINRVGVGIYYRVNWPIPTEVVGLTQENVTFNPIGETAAQYQDVDYYHY